MLVADEAGFIGCQHSDGTMVVLNALSYAGNRANLATLEGRTNFESVCGDINKAKMGTIIHFAAGSYFHRSTSGLEAFYETNAMGHTAC